MTLMEVLGRGLFRSPPADVTSTPTPVRLSDRLATWADTHRRWLFGALVVLYGLSFNNQWRMDPDSALYLTVGRNVAAGQGYSYHGQAHHLAYPGLPWLWAGAFKVFGTHDLLAHHVLMMLIGFAALALTYRLIHLHSDRRTAVTVTLLVGLSMTFYRYCFELMSDMPFLMAVLAFLVGYEALFTPRPISSGASAEGRGFEVAPGAGIAMRPSSPAPPSPGRGNHSADADAGPATARWFDWLLLLGGLSAVVITRPAMWSLLTAVVAAVIWLVIRGTVRWGLVLVMLAVIVAAIAFYRLGLRHGGSHGVGGYEEALLNLLQNNFPKLAWRALTGNLPKVFEPTAAEAFFGLDLGKGVNVFASVGVLLLAVTLFRHRVLWGMLVVMTLLMMIVVEVHVRYLLAVLPLLVYAGWRALAWINHRLPEVHAERVFVAMMVLFLGLNVIKIGGFAIDQRWAPFLNRYKDGRLAAIPQVAEALREKTPPVSWVLVAHKHGRMLTYLSGKYCVEPNDATKLDPLTQNVYVLEPLDPAAQQWMKDERIALGPQVATISNHGREPYVLYRALRSPPPANATP